MDTEIRIPVGNLRKSVTFRRLRKGRWLQWAWLGTRSRRSSQWICPTGCWCRLGIRPRGCPPPTRTCGWFGCLAEVLTSWRNRSAICWRSYCRARTTTSFRLPVDINRVILTTHDMNGIKIREKSNFKIGGAGESQ